MFDFMCVVVGIFVVPISMVAIYVVLKFLYFLFGGSVLENMLDI